MINFDHNTKKHKKHNPNWSKISDHLHRILITRGSIPGKTNALFNLRGHQPDIDKCI